MFFNIAKRLKETMIKKNFVILVLCHTRTWHLAKVLESLENCEKVEDFEILFIAHDSPDQTMNIINNFNHLKKSIFRIENVKFPNAASAINNNLYIGLRHAFEILRADLVCVIEDDVVLSKDALKYFIDTNSHYESNQRFRGSIGYSINVLPNQEKGDVLRINYGIGWGWSVNEKNFRNLLKFWKGSELNHWDYFVEPYIRTGFVVAPLYSKVRNIGFDETASHSGDAVNFGKMIDESFEIGNAKTISSIREVSVPYEHIRSDLSVLSNMNSLHVFLLFKLRDLSFMIYRLGIASHPRMHFLWRLLRNWTDRKFDNSKVRK
jgi:hypothetical protein